MPALLTLFRLSLFETKGRTRKRGTVQLARTRDSPRAKQSYTGNFHRPSHSKPTVSLYCRDLYKGRCNYGVGVAGKIVAPNRKPRSENQMGLAVRSLRRPCSTPAEHACVWRRSDCATSGPQEQSSEHGWSLARRRVRYVAVGGSARGRGSRPAADLCLRRG